MNKQRNLVLVGVLIATLLAGCAEPIEEVATTGTMEEPQEAFETLELDLSLEDLLSKHVEARGGSEALASLEAVRLEGTFSSVQDGEFMVEDAEVVITLAPGRFHRVIGGTGHIDSVDVDSAWRISPGGGIPEPTPMSDEDAARYRRLGDLAGPLVDPAAKGHTLELVDKVQDGKEAFYRVNLNHADGVSVLVFIDAETFLVARLRERRMAGGVKVTQVTTYRGYQEVDGVAFPHVENIQFLEVGFRQESKWQVVTVNPEIPPDLFVQPAS
jgi:hypothetical protein